jgi:hypothetical protein
MRKEDVLPRRNRKGEEAAQRTEDHGVELGRDDAPVVASRTWGVQSPRRWPRRDRGAQ